MTEDDLAVRSYVCEVIPDCSTERIRSIDRFRSGENHTVYRVSYLDPQDHHNELIVRVGSGDAAERLRAQREASVLSKVGGIAAPKLYDFAPNPPWFKRPVMCLQFISGHQYDLAEAGDQDMTRLGAVVESLHALPVDDLTDWDPEDIGLSDYIEERWQRHLVTRLASIRDPLPAPLQQRLRAAVGVVSGSLEMLKAVVEAGPEECLVLLHADISGANIIWAPDPVLIDWEYARLGDPADELAYLFTQNHLSAPQRAAFWRGYSPNPTGSRLNLMVNRVRYWEPMTLLGSVLWWLDAWSRADEAAGAEQTDPSLPRPAEYYLGEALRRLDHFDEMSV